MITIHGVPLSVHTRKAIVTAILKKIDYRFEVVIPVIPDNPPANWSTLSPTGLIPVMQDGDFTLADSTAICLYLERKQPAPPILPADIRDYARALWFDAYAGGTIFRHVVHPLFVQKIVGSEHPQGPDRQGGGGRRSDERAAKNPSAISTGRSTGKFLVGNAMTLADIAIVSNFIVYQYLGLRRSTPADIRSSSRYLREITATEAFQRALADERPFVDQMGLKRDFLSAA